MLRYLDRSASPIPQIANSLKGKVVFALKIVDVISRLRSLTFERVLSVIACYQELRQVEYDPCVMKTTFLFMAVLSLFEAGRAQQRWDTYVTSLQMPCYPPMARVARVQGTAKIKLVKTADGSVKSAEAMEGSPLLTKAAVDNVRTWKFTTPDYHDPLEPTIVVFEYKLQDGSDTNKCATRVVFQSWNRVTVVSNFLQPMP
jgi:TonB family protein